MNAWAERLDRIPGPAAVLAAVAIHAALSLVAMSGESATYDEPAHLGAGYSYLRTGDFRLNPEHPPLAKLLAALPLTFMDVKPPADADAWESGRQWDYGYSLLYESGNDADRLLFWARVPTLFWSAVVVVAVYVAARGLYGPRRALLALTLAAFCPTLLAHGHLVTTDVPLTALFLLTLIAFGAFLRIPSGARAVGTGLALGGALASKYSAVALVPILTVLGGAAVWLTHRRNPERPKPSAWLRAAALSAVIAGTALLVVWACYGFRYTATPEGNWPFGEREGFATGLARKIRLLPEAYLAGMENVADHVRRGHRTYALGEEADRFWWYFPFAFAVKTPIPALLLFGAGLVDAIRRRGRSEAFLIVPLFAYWALALWGNLNLGVRHLLPTLPLLMILGAGFDVPRNAWSTWRGKLAALGAPATALSTLLAAPFFLGYFNEGARLVWERHEMLTGSNLDWGQDLRRLKRHLDAEGIGKIKLAYFGTASPRQAGLDFESLPVRNLFADRHPETIGSWTFVPGDVVAVSATHLVSRDAPALHALLQSEPDAVIGHSIFVYRFGHGR